MVLNLTFYLILIKFKLSMWLVSILDNATLSLLSLKTQTRTCTHLAIFLTHMPTKQTGAKIRRGFSQYMVYLKISFLTKESAQVLCTTPWWGWSSGFRVLNRGARKMQQSNSPEMLQTQPSSVGHPQNICLSTSPSHPVQAPDWKKPFLIAS